jgi:hypothetical protein
MFHLARQVNGTALAARTHGGLPMHSHDIHHPASVRVVAVGVLALAALLLPRGALSTERSTELQTGLPATPVATTEPSWIASAAPAEVAPAIDPAPGEAAAAPAELAPAAAVALSTAARPSDPQVQPCRHLPARQMLECMKITGGIDPRLMR